MPRLEAANANPESIDSKRLLASLHPHIITLGSKTPFSPSARKASFNHLLAGLNRSLSPCLPHCPLVSCLTACLCVSRFGTGQLFVTMAFNEVCTVLLSCILGTHHSMQLHSQHSALTNFHPTGQQHPSDSPFSPVQEQSRVSCYRQ
jgi:hypothetical protein